tara:strand:- start:653 stop:1612 length:960 start_codon:yes stop_codon:yes gene_type:complete
MGLSSGQVRHMYVGTADVADFAALKAGVANSLVVLGADGAAVAAGGDFKLFQKDALGNIISSDTIKADNVLKVSSVAYAAPALRKYTIGGLTVDVNSLYTVRLTVEGFGSLSPEDEYVKMASYKAVTGDDQEAIVDGLIVSLNRNFSREPGSTATSNTAFTFTKTGSGATAALVIEGKIDDAQFDGNKFTRVFTQFTADISATTYPTVALTEAGSKGKGTGYQVVRSEFELLGERGDTMRLGAYPHNINGPALVATKDGTYDLIEISYFDEGRDEAKKSNKQLTIAMPTADVPNANVNSVIADLNTILGAGSVVTIKAS